MSFELQFSQAIQFKTQFDPAFSLDEPSRRLLETTFSQTREMALQDPFFSIRQRICTQAVAYASDRDVEPFTYQCLADSHTFLQACLDSHLVNEKYMTLSIGDVSFDGDRMFDTTRQSIENCVNTGISTADRAQFHVWLTLADMTVIDLTIISQLVKLQYLPAPSGPEQWLTVWRPERKGRFDYHPMLIDDDFLSRLQKPAH